jgi:hypothetical protein
MAIIAQLAGPDWREAAYRSSKTRRQHAPYAAPRPMPAMILTCRCTRAQHQARRSGCIGG